MDAETPDNPRDRVPGHFNQTRGELRHPTESSTTLRCKGVAVCEPARPQVVAVRMQACSGRRHIGGRALRSIVPPHARALDCSESC
jgi:hypothetical protein